MRAKRESRFLYLFTGPWLLGFLVLTVLPALYALSLSFNGEASSTEAVWKSLDNYRALFASPAFQAAGMRTLLWAAIAVPLELAFSLFLALLLHTSRRGVVVYRSLFTLPAFLGSSAGSAFALKSLLPGLAPFPLLILWTVWQAGTGMLLLFAGLKQIPNELYESASMDGAGRLRRLIHITLPELSPLLYLNLLLYLINAVVLLSPALLLDELSLYGPTLYRTAFSEGLWGFAAAGSVTLQILVGLLALCAVFTSSRWKDIRGTIR